MNIEILSKEKTIASIYSEKVIIKDLRSALDLIMAVSYEYNANSIAINKEAIAEEFFILSSGLAGEILQKFVNYQVKFAVYGDFSKYTSKPLKDFIFESNKGTDVFFVNSYREAVEKLNNA